VTAEPPADVQPICGAVLFGAEIPLMRVIAMEIPVHPHDLAYCAPVQGPAPLVCVRDPHPGYPVHCDGNGTLWC